MTHLIYLTTYLFFDPSLIALRNAVLVTITNAFAIVLFFLAISALIERKLSKAVGLIFLAIVCSIFLDVAIITGLAKALVIWAGLA